MKKQILLAIVMLTPLLTSAEILERININGIYYNLNQETKQAEVTNSVGWGGGGYSGNIVIPQVVEYNSLSYSVTTIGYQAFWNCSVLTSVTIPNSVTTIDSSAFDSCSGLTSLTIPNSVTSIGNQAFGNCTGLISMTIPSSVTVIETQTFLGCSNLTSVSIPNSVTSIEYNAFRNCSSLTSVTIPNSVTSIGAGAFSGCSSLNSVHITDLSAWCDIKFFTSLTLPFSRSYHLILNGTEINNLVIPDNVTTIGEGAFCYCSYLTSVTLPNSVSSIGANAFQYCSSLASVSIPNSVTSIGANAFYSCSSLTSVTIPNSVTSISENAFYWCKKLTSISIGSGIKTIGKKAFAECESLENVYCHTEIIPSAEKDAFNNSYIDYATLHVPEISLSQYKRREPWSGFGTFEPLADGIVFADDAVKVLCVANWDTNNNGELSEEEAAAVTDLGSVFANNTDITSFDELSYFTGLTVIRESAFCYCSNLTSITIPDNVKTIGNRAFYACSNLASLRIHSNVTSIEDRAFAYCSKLESIKVDAANTVYDSRNNCNALIETSSNALLIGCKNTTIPSSVKVIADGAFRGCTELTDIEIPEGVTTIGASAFRGCTGLTSVTLPSTTTSIGNYAFSAFDEVYNLTSVTAGMTSPVAITSEVFPNRANSTLYVPKGSRTAYMTANYWKDFKKIVELDNGIPLKCETPTITLLANGKIKVQSMTEGATCVTNVTASNAEPLTDGEISLNTPLTVYTVTAYATAEGYADSDLATATFRWEKTFGDINGDGTVNISDVIQLVNIILQE